LKIAVYTFLNLRNGAGGERWIENVAPKLRELGHEVTVFSSEFGQPNDMEISSKLVGLGIQIHEYRTYTKLFKIPTVYSLKKILSMLEKAKIDVLYFNNGFALNEIVVYLLKVIGKIKVVSGHHGTFPEVGSMLRKSYHQIVNRNVNRLYDGHHVLNKEREQILKSWGYKNVYKIPYGVDTNMLRPGRKDDVFTVMFAGSMLYQKGVDRLARLVEFLNTNNNSSKKSVKIKFLLFGSGPLSSIFIDLSKRFENVAYIGYGYPEQLAEAYRRSHVFVSPSRFEEFGLVNLEAQASGTPVVASDIPGPREIVKNGLTGFLVDASILDEMVKPILLLEELWYNKTDEYNNYCLKSRENALNYEWNRVVIRIEQMLSDIV
jgi:glycosyltransferase involved in cell wall biosynthesis